MVRISKISYSLAMSTKRHIIKTATKGRTSGAVLGLAAMVCLISVFSFSLVSFAGNSRIELSGLIDRSPFLPPDHNKQAPTPPPPRVDPGPGISQSYRFTGLLEIGDRKRYAFHDLKQDRGFWVDANESASEVSVVQFDASSQRVMVRVNNQSGWLALERPAIPLSTYTPPEPERPRERAEERRTRRVEEGQEGEERRWPRRRRVIVPQEGSDRPERM